MNDLYAAASIRYYFDDNAFTENLILTDIANFADAVAKIERYYGTDLDAILYLELFEGPFPILNDKAFKAFINGEYDN